MNNSGGSRTAATSKMERFVIIVVNYITKRSILDVAAALGRSLISLKVDETLAKLKNFTGKCRTLLNIYDGGFCKNTYWFLVVNYFCRRFYHKRSKYASTFLSLSKDKLLDSRLRRKPKSIKANVGMWKWLKTYRNQSSCHVQA